MEHKNLKVMTSPALFGARPLVFAWVRALGRPLGIDGPAPGAATGPPVDRGGGYPQDRGGPQIPSPLQRASRGFSPIHCRPRVLLAQPVASNSFREGGRGKIFQFSHREILRRKEGVMGGSKTLIGREKICKFLEISKERFYRLVEEGLPVKKTGIGWVGNKDLLDDYFLQKITTLSDQS